MKTKLPEPVNDYLMLRLNLINGLLPTMEDRATLGSDLSADADFKEGGYPDRTALIALRKTKAINPSGNF